jgi:Protein of unknown function (DUF3592)
MRLQKSFLRILLSRSEGWFLVFFSIAGMTVLIVLATQFLEAHRLATEGASAVANVIDLQIYSGEGGTHHVVTYAFLVEGDWVEHSSDVAEAYYSGLREEDRVPVRYLREDPAVARIELAAARTSSFFSTLYYTALSVFMAFLARENLKEIAGIYWLSRNGVPQQTVVTGHVEETSSDGPSSWRMTWLDLDGRTRSSCLFPPDKVPQIGSMITILTDPSGKRPSLWEGDL